jgi:hypothetical protein
MQPPLLIYDCPAGLRTSFPSFSRHTDFCTALLYPCAMGVQATANTLLWKACCRSGSGTREGEADGDPCHCQRVFPRRTARYGGLADLGKTQIIGMPTAACRLSRSVWRQRLQGPGEVDRIQAKLGEGLTRFPLTTAVMMRCKTLNWPQSSLLMVDGGVSVRVGLRS